MQYIHQYPELSVLLNKNTVGVRNEIYRLYEEAKKKVSKLSIKDLKKLEGAVYGFNLTDDPVRKKRFWIKLGKSIEPQSRINDQGGIIIFFMKTKNKNLLERLVHLSFDFAHARRSQPERRKGTEWFYFEEKINVEQHVALINELVNDIYYPDSESESESDSGSDSESDSEYENSSSEDEEIEYIKPRTRSSTFHQRRNHKLSSHEKRKEDTSDYDESDEENEPGTSSTNYKKKEVIPNKPNKKHIKLVNINTASYSELVTLVHIADKKARSIMIYRESRPFRCIEDLENVGSVGKKSVEDNRKWICV